MTRVYKRVGKRVLYFVLLCVNAGVLFQRSTCAILHTECTYQGIYPQTSGLQATDGRQLHDIIITIDPIEIGEINFVNMLFPEWFGNDDHKGHTEYIVILSIITM